MDNNRKIRTIFSAKETGLFIDVWRAHIVQLRSARRNSQILIEMCEELKSYDIILSVEEVRTRINNLTKKFREEKKKCVKTGGSPSNWEFYEKINEMVGCYKINRSEDLVEESSISYNASDEESLVSSMSDSPASLISAQLCSPTLATAQLEGDPDIATSSKSRISERDSRRSAKRKNEDNIKELLSLSRKEVTLFEKYIEENKEADTQQKALLQRLATAQGRILNILETQSFQNG